MSDLTTIILMLAVFVFASLTSTFFLGRMYKRCDAILTGMVNGVPVSLRSRRLYLWHDYLGVSFGLTFVLGVMAVGFVSAGEAVGDSSAKNLAYLCAGVAAWGFLFNLVLGFLWVAHFVSVLRQAEAD